MKLLARLLSHGFAVALVVLLAIGFIYRGELFPEWELPDFLAFDSAESTADDALAGKIEPAPIQEEQLASGPATGDQQASGVEDAAAGAMPPVEVVEASEAEMPAAPAVEEDTPAVEAPVTTIEVVEEPLVLEVQESVEEAAPPVPEATADAPTETVSQDAGTAPAPVPEAVTAPDVAESAAPMPSSVEPVVASEEAAQDPASQVEADEAVPYYQLLASAREAYWLRDYQTAEDFYRRMIADDPDNPDGYGELANMYFSQGNWEAAASAYYEAGSRLVKAGLLAPARELVDVIRGLNGPQADALDQEVQAAHESLQ
jgi:tetratricopeptide (TPR) repeat protein